VRSVDFPSENFVDETKAYVALLLVRCTHISRTCIGQSTFPPPKSKSNHNPAPSLAIFTSQIKWGTTAPWRSDRIPPPLAYPCSKEGDLNIEKHKDRTRVAGENTHSSKIRRIVRWYTHWRWNIFTSSVYLIKSIGTTGKRSAITELILN